jgi:hypothetical protein
VYRDCGPGTECYQLPAAGPLFCGWPAGQLAPIYTLSCVGTGFGRFLSLSADIFVRSGIHNTVTSFL